MQRPENWHQFGDEVDPNFPNNSMNDTMNNGNFSQPMLYQYPAFAVPTYSEPMAAQSHFDGRQPHIGSGRSGLNDYNFHTPPVSVPVTPSLSNTSAESYFPSDEIHSVVSQTISRSPNKITKPKEKKAKKTPKQAKPKTEKLGDIPTLVIPVSEDTRFEHVPVRDMIDWVSRNVDVRHEEARKKGKIPRPMNCFLLYRSAYTQKAKALCKQENHQLVSKVCAKSWKLEGKEVTAKYKAMAETEKVNHLTAYPDYKFSPSKGSNEAKGSKSSEDIDIELSDLSEVGHDWDEVNDVESIQFSSQQTNPSDWVGIAHTLGSNRSSYERNNPGKPLPAMMGQSQLGQYYQQTVRNSALAPNVQDVVMRRAVAPQTDNSGTPPLVSVPNMHQTGNFEYDFSPNPHNSASLPEAMRLDPLLLAHDQNQIIESENSNGFLGQQLPEMRVSDASNDFDFGYDSMNTVNSHSYHPGNQVLTDHSDWHAEMDRVGEFDQWMSEHGGH